MSKQNCLFLFFIISIYFTILFIFKREIFFFRFDEDLIKRYFLSQDIPHEVAGKRLFLSDGEIYLATGILYLKGYDPSELNFEHPPLIKYLFGLSILFLKNPLITQLIFGVGILILVYLLSFRIYKNQLISLLSSLLVLIDPLFLDLSSQPLLDLGQTFFFLLYFIAIFYLPKNYLFQGLCLALFCNNFCRL